MIASDIKDAYAIALARYPNDVLKCAMMATQGNLGLALELMTECRDDPGFDDRQRDLIGDDAASYIPDKDKVAFEILAIGRDLTASKDTRLKAYTLFCNLMGMIDKPGEGGTVNRITNFNRVMVVQKYASPDEWEAATMAQQAKLIEHAQS